MNRMIIIFCKFILERDQLSIELLYKSVIYIYIFFKNKFAKILLLLLIEFKIDTLFPSVTVKLRNGVVEDRGSRIGIPPRSIIFTPDWRWAPLPRSQSSVRDVSLFMRHRC